MTARGGFHDYGVSPTADNMPGPEFASTRSAIREATTVLSSAGFATARIEAELLTSYVLGVPRGRLLLAPALTPEQAARLRRLVLARAGRTPLQHLTGSAPFRRIELAVGPGVFVPRPETELLVEWGLAGLDRSAPVVVDLCSGSGAIALALVDERPDAVVYAVEREPAALRWLLRNAAPAGGPPVVTVVAGDATDASVLAELDGTVDLVLANPPYVPAGTPLPPEVGRHDPATALFAGEDGLDVIRRLVPRAAALLRPGGRFGVEHDDSHADAVPRLLRADPRLTGVADHADLAGRPRFATARRLADCTA